MVKKLLAISLLIFIGARVFAQGDGPRSYLLAPESVWGVVPKWLNLNQNLLPAGNILVDGADIKIDVFPTTFFHTLGIKGRFAQILIMANPGTATGSLENSPPALPRTELNASGFSDGFVAFKMGLINAPALNIKEFASQPHSFSLNGYFRLWYSGTYDSNKLLNLGSNRLTFELGAPMAIPFGKNPKRATWLEVYPNIQFFTDNNDPARSSTSQKIEQQPLFLLENHLTHNFTTKFWAGLDLRYHFGGQTIADGIKDDNRINMLGGGVSAGYQLLPFLAANASYGQILLGENNAQSEMIRLTLTFSYVNMKKIQTPNEND